MKQRTPSGRDMAIYYEVRVVRRTQKAVARQFGLTQPRVSQIVRRVTAWRADQSPSWGPERNVDQECRLTHWECRERTSVLLSWAMTDYLQSRRSVTTKKSGTRPSGDFAETTVREQRANPRLLKLAMDLNEQLRRYDDLPLPPEPPKKERTEDSGQETETVVSEPVASSQWPETKVQWPEVTFEQTPAASASESNASEEEQRSQEPGTNGQEQAESPVPAYEDDNSRYLGGSPEAHTEFFLSLTPAERSDVCMGKLVLRELYEQRVKNRKNISRGSKPRSRAPGERRPPRTAADFERVERRLLSRFEDHSATVLWPEQADQDAAEILKRGRMAARLAGVDRPTLAFLARWQKIRRFRSRLLGDIQLPQPRKADPDEIWLTGNAAHVPSAGTDWQMMGTADPTA